MFFEAEAKESNDGDSRASSNGNSVLEKGESLGSRTTSRGSSLTDSFGSLSDFIEWVFIRIFK